MDAAIRPPVKHSRHISTDEKLFSPLLTAFETTLAAIFRPLIIMCGLVAQLYPPVCNPMECSPPGSSLHGDSLGTNTGVGCHFLLQVIFLTQGSSSGLLH